MRIPISFKITGLTVFIVVGTTFWIAKQSSDSLQKEMTMYVDSSNLSEAEARAKEVDYLLSSSLEHAQIIGTMMIKGASDDQISLNFNKDKDLVSVEVWKVVNQKLEYVGRKTKEDFFTAQKVSKDWINDVRQKVPFPIRSVMNKNVEIRNSTLDGKVPLVTIGVPLTKDENGIVTNIALVDIRLELLQKPFATANEKTVYLIDRNGVLLAHPDDKLVLAQTNFANFPLVEKALDEKSAPRLQTKFKDPETGAEFFGAYVRNPTWGVTVIAQTPENLVLEPAFKVRRAAIYISGIVISVALFLCFLFSMTLTGPIEKLADLIKLVSKGNFNVKARSQVRSNDEVGDLAIAFDQMTEGLKERDKVKNLFNKFHGSSVTEDLLKGDMAVGGTRKDVTVFFSDIRGFTKFSEGHTPEEVVSMLNEYFAVMVRIINQSGGVVDKFIGDAIMAIWGAPHGTDRDTQNAVKAALDMRKALAELNELRHSRGQTPIMIGMGLHCGPAISGTIGSEERMEYTVIGDTVNMTSRIEASTKAFGTDLLISDDIFHKVGAEFSLEYAGAAEVKGKSEPLKLYKVRGMKNEAGAMVEIRTPYSDYEPEHADKVKIAS